jgi:phosphohistidine phosphatase SixA
MRVRTRFSVICMLMVGVGIALVAGVADAQSLSSSELAAALRRGGYVLVMRHASSPREAPNKETANADNRKLERQLDEAGRTGATAMGQALRSLKIPVGDVFTSPTYRALETVKFALLANATPVVELGDGGQSMQGVAEAQATWLRAKVTQGPTRGNTIIVTHMPNLARAFPEWGPGVLEGNGYSSSRREGWDDARREGQDRGVVTVAIEGS